MGYLHNTSQIEKRSGGKLQHRMAKLIPGELSAYCSTGFEPSVGCPMRYDIIRAWKSSSFNNPGCLEVSCDLTWVLGTYARFPLQPISLCSHSICMGAKFALIGRNQSKSADASKTELVEE